jgi:hypothetical protein
MYIENIYYGDTVFLLSFVYLFVFSGNQFDTI